MLAADLLVDLTRRYCEPHRRYHTVRHIADMLWRGREQALSDEQIAAIWYHDAVYDIPGPDNEAASAALAVRQLGAAGWAPDRVALVEGIVLDTKEHHPNREESRLVIDLDLASLADPWDRFEANGRALREEFAGVAEDEFRAGQRATFERFLAKDAIYHTPWGRPLEVAARANLARGLAELGASDRG